MAPKARLIEDLLANKFESYEIEMQSHGTSFELPRESIVDVIGIEMQLLGMKHASYFIR
jgi:hypothetical protein